MKFLFIATCAPRPLNPTKGIFVQQMANALVLQGHEVDILVPVRVFPTKELKSCIVRPSRWAKFPGALRKWTREWVHTSSEVTLEGVHYIYKRFVTLPRVSNSGMDCALFAESSRTWLASRFPAGGYSFVLGHFAETIPLVLHMSRQQSCSSGVYIHEDIQDYCRIVNRDYLRDNLAKCDFIFTNSYRSQSQLRAVTAACGQIDVVHLGIDEIFRRNQSRGDVAPAKEVKLVCVARFTERKNQLLLLEALSLLKSTRQDFNLHLTLVGDDSLYRHQLARQVKDLNLEPSVRFTDATNLDVICKALQQADIFIFPSKFESFGVVVIEAASQGLPIISSTEIGAVKELELSGFSLSTFDPRSAGGLATSIELMLENYKEHLAAAQVIRDFVILEYSWENTALEIVNAIRGKLNELKSA